MVKYRVTSCVMHRVKFSRGWLGVRFRVRASDKV